MSHGVYRVTVENRRRETQRILNSATEALAGLRDPTTTYGRELSALVHLYRSVLCIWVHAADDIAEVDAKAGTEPKETPTL